MLRLWERQSPAVRYVVPRIFALVLAWLIATIAIFYLLFVAKDPVSRYLPASASQQQRTALRQRIGLDQPAYRRYSDWLSDFLRGDLGTDDVTHRSISAAVKRKAQPTIELLVLSLSLGAATGAGLSALARRRGGARRASQFTQAVVGSLPVIALAPLVIIIPAQYWGYAPPGLGSFTPFYRHPWLNVREFVPPAVLVALPVAAFVAVELSRWNAFGTMRGLLFSAARAFPIAASGVIVAEQIFGIPGLGNYILQSATNRDIFVLQSALAIVALAASVCWLLPPRPPEPSDRVSDGAPRTSWRWRDPLLITALVLIVAFVLAGIIGPFAAPHNPQAFNARPNSQPSISHLFGTDRLGRDELSRLLRGARTELKFVSAIIGLALVPGVLAGLALRKWGRWLARAAAELSWAWSSFPWLVVVFAFAASYGFGLKTFAFVLGVGAFLSGAALASQLCAAQARSLSGVWYAIGPSFVAQTASIAALALLAEVTMGFLGLSTARVSWGRDLGDDMRTFPYHYTLAAFVSGVLCATLLGWNLLRSAAAAAQARVLNSE